MYDIALHARIELSEVTGLSCYRTVFNNPPGYFVSICLAGQYFTVDDAAPWRALESECRSLAKDVTARKRPVIRGGHIVLDDQQHPVYVVKEWNPIETVARFLGPDAVGAILYDYFSNQCRLLRELDPARV